MTDHATNVVQTGRTPPYTPAPEGVATVLHSGGLYLASEKAVVEKALGEKPGVVKVECNPVAQTTSAVYDPGRTSVAELRACIESCGYECAGESVPTYLSAVGHAPAAPTAPVVPHAPPAHGEMVMAPEEAMGHGGHAGMSMSAMVRDMRNRFLVALVLS